MLEWNSGDETKNLEVGGVFESCGGSRQNLGRGTVSFPDGQNFAGLSQAQGLWTWRSFDGNVCG